MYPHTKGDQVLGQVLSAKTKRHNFKIFNLNFKFINTGISNNQAFDQLGTVWAVIQFLL